ncbi:MAG TPA: hypothetical protein VNO30_20025 [Kofleriaceae bacterium]|nr:hypothetical protein [Kofleriaceae bacterium]
MTCSDSSSCNVKCNGDCRTTCTGGAACAVTCGDAGSPATVCSPGVFACGPC